MKTMKKLFALLLALTMVFGLAATGFAAKITVKETVKGQEYTAYKIFDVTTVGDDPDKQYSYTIDANSPWFDVIEDAMVKDAEDGEEYAPFELVPSPGDNTKYAVKPDDKFTPNATYAAGILAKYLMANKPTGLTENVDFWKKTSDGTDVEFALEKPGYYFVDSSLGSLCILNTAADEVEVNEKNDDVTSDKKITGGTDEDKEYIDKKVGDKVTFELYIKPGGLADTTYIVHDNMSEGLDLVENSFKFFYDADGEGTGAPVEYTNMKDKPMDGAVKDTELDDGYVQKADAVWSFSKNPTCIPDPNTNNRACSFEITIGNDFTHSIPVDEDDYILITYDAILNEKAIVEATDTTMKEENKMDVQYGNSWTPEQGVTVETFRFDLVKHNAKNELLNGAEFKLYDKDITVTGEGDDKVEDRGNEIPVVFVETLETGENVYRVAKKDVDGKYTETGVVIKAGVAIIKGLDKGTYWLEETKAPVGYNMLDKRIKVDMSNGNNDATYTCALNEETTEDTTDVEGSYTEGGVGVLNQSGNVLPATGGMGTTLFYVFGSILMLGATVLLVAKKRTNI